jgi:hypothetical protein
VALPPQFYETVVLLRVGDKHQALSYVSSPPLPKGAEVHYGELLDEAFSVTRIPLGRVPEALGALFRIPALSPDEQLSLVRDPELLGSFVSGEDYEIGLQAARLSVVPVEASPLVKRAVTEIVTSGGAATLGFFAGGPILMVLSPLGLLAVRGFASAVWEGARPEVVEFSGDAAAALLDALREKLGIPRRRPPGPPSR